jgi:hypothetical protein
MKTPGGSEINATERADLTERAGLLMIALARLLRRTNRQEIEEAWKDVDRRYERLSKILDIMT